MKPTFSAWALFIAAQAIEKGYHESARRLHAFIAAQAIEKSSSRHV